MESPKPSPDGRGPVDLGALLSRSGADYVAPPLSRRETDALDPLSPKQCAHAIAAMAVAASKAYIDALENGMNTETEALHPMLIQFGLHEKGMLVPLEIIDSEPVAPDDPTPVPFGPDKIALFEKFGEMLNAEPQDLPAMIGMIAGQLNHPRVDAVMAIFPTITERVVGTGKSMKAAQADAERKLRKAKQSDSGNKRTITFALFTPWHFLGAILDPAPFRKMTEGEEDAVTMIPVILGDNERVRQPFDPEAVRAAFWTLQSDGAGGAHE